MSWVLTYDLLFNGRQIHRRLVKLRENRWLASEMEQQFGVTSVNEEFCDTLSYSRPSLEIWIDLPKSHYLFCSKTYLIMELSLTGWRQVGKCVVAAVAADAVAAISWLCCDSFSCVQTSVSLT